jgi:hypothetical protein
MKRLSISLLSAGAIMILVLSSYSSERFQSKSQVISPVTFVRYQVNVNFLNELELCNTYLVQILDQNRQPVTNAQVFVPGKLYYYFYEPGPVVGVRIAVLVVNNNPHYICSQELVTNPAVNYGLFQRGQTYNFDLYPKISNPKASVK